jgi:hypothetical protein
MLPHDNPNAIISSNKCLSRARKIRAPDALCALVRLQVRHAAGQAVGWSCPAYVPVSELIMRPFVQMPRGFYHLATSACALDYKIR